MPMPTIDETYLSSMPADYPLLQRMRLRIRDVTFKKEDWGPYYFLVLDQLDGQPWAKGEPARIPASQSKILGRHYGKAPESWRGHVIDMWPQEVSVGKQVYVCWYVEPTDLPAKAPASQPRPEPPLANTAPEGQHRPTAAGNGQGDDLDDILGGDEVPRFDPEPPAPQPAAQGKRGPGRPRKEVP